ncbi:hypothetical protein [Microbacterium jejuense]|uniref:hypothetical protein n=1 Tax=Microbacterium jejuense TaxID=1263637 RepID=UPI0031F0AC5F
MAAVRSAGVLALVAALLLSGCASPEQGGPELDSAAVIAALAGIDGVTAADASAYSTGTPTSYGVRTEISVDDAGLAAIGDVMGSAVDVLAAQAAGFRTYVIEVSAPDPENPGTEMIVTLADYQDQMPFTQGSYLGWTLTLTADELQQAAGS